MHCNICDRILSVREIKYNKKFNTYDPCVGCLEIINQMINPYDELDFLRDVWYDYSIEELMEEQPSQTINE